MTQEPLVPPANELEINAAADALEIKARAFVSRIDAVLLRVITKPESVFTERVELVRDLRDLLANQAWFSDQRARQSQALALVERLTKGTI